MKFIKKITTIIITSVVIFAISIPSVAEESYNVYYSGNYTCRTNPNAYVVMSRTNLGVSAYQITLGSYIRANTSIQNLGYSGMRATFSTYRYCDADGYFIGNTCYYNLELVAETEVIGGSLFEPKRINILNKGRNAYSGVNQVFTKPWDEYYP